MSKFIEVTSGYDGSKCMINADLIAQVEPYKNMTQVVYFHDNKFCNHIVKNSYDEIKAMIMDDVPAIGDVPAINGWISVKDRLPNYNDFYRLQNYDFLCRVIVPQGEGIILKKMAVIEYDDSLCRWDCDDMIVTHWMPLPEYPIVEAEI